MGTKQSRSRQLATRLMYATLVLLDKNGGEMRISEIVEQLDKEMNFGEWERFKLGNGNMRWVTTLYFYSIDLVKADFIVKNRGRWFLTDGGKDAIAKYDADTLFDVAHHAYNEWYKNQACAAKDEDDADAPDLPSVPQFADIKAQAADDLMNYIYTRTPYEFQDMVAALFRAMGYYTPFVAPKGKDGGVDIIAYRDPLGAIPPIVKVQVKHYSPDNPVTVDVVRNIVGVAKNDVPVVVTSGRFAEPARFEARQNNVRLIDGYEFSDLWIQYFDKMSEGDKARMPIEPVYIIKRDE